MTPTDEALAKEAHMKWLGKAETAKIRGSEMTVLPYGYLQTAVKEMCARARSDEQKKYEGADVEGMVRELVAEFLERNKLVFFYHDQQLRKDGLNPANHSEAAGLVLAELATTALTRAHAAGCKEERERQEKERTDMQLKAKQ